jgi:hypothetical protein
LLAGQRFSQLESKLKDSPEKEAISILHAMLLELRRQQAAVGQAAEAGGGATGPSGKNGRSNLDYVANLYSHGAWATVRGITFPLLADFHPKGEVAQRYEVFRDTDGFSERALYVVDGDGIIRYCHVSPELHQIPDIYELFEQLDKLPSAPVGLPAR